MTSPLVSVVMPCYNAEEFLREAVESVLCQSWPAVELIAVDDASTDNTAAILYEYAHRSANVRVVQHAVNCGLSAARNAGYAQAQGDYLLWLDSDDYLAPDFIAVLVREAQRVPHALVAGPWRKVRLLGGRWTADAHPITHTLVDDVLHQMLRGGWPLHCMACLFPRRAIEDLRGWNADICMHEDRLLLSQLLIRGFPTVFVHESCAFYRLRVGSMATLRSEAITQSVLNVARLIEVELRGVGRLAEFSNDVAHFLDLYYIDSLLRTPQLAAELLSMRNAICPHYRDRRAWYSRVLRRLVGDKLFAQLALQLGVSTRR